MKETTISSNQLRSIISDIKTISIFKTLIPVSWGFWNSAACVTCITFPLYEKIIWICMIAAGIFCHLIIFHISKRKRGFELTIDSVIKWLWLFILIAIVEIAFIFPELNNFYDRKYTVPFVILLIGIGIIINGKVQKELLIIIIGLLWVITSNIIILKIKYLYYIYAVLSFVTLILSPIMIYFFARLKNEHAGK